MSENPMRIVNNSLVCVECEAQIIEAKAETLRVKRENAKMKSTIREFLSILNKRDCKDDGITFFRPTRIHSCRTLDLIRIEELLEKMEGVV